MPVRVKAKSFGLSKKTDDWIIPETSDPTPHAVVALVDDEIGRAEQPNPAPAAQEAEAAPMPEETQGMRLEREARDLAAAWQSSRQLGQPIGEGGLSSGSNVEDMRNWLKALGAPVWSTKTQMWPRLVHAEARRELQKRDEAWLADCAKELAETGGQGELRVPRAPDGPSPEERARPELTHPPCQPWCAWCVMEKGRGKPRLQRPVESVKVPEFEMDFCHLLQDPKRRHQPGMVDVAAQNPLCAAVSTESDENAYLSPMCAAFVKRMAYATAVLKVDPQPALKLLADKVAVRASADGIQLKVETAPRFSSQNIGAVGRAQDAVEGQIRSLRLELGTRLSMEGTPTMDVWPWLVRYA